MASSAVQAVGGDLDGDKVADIISIRRDGSLWVKYSSTGTWQQLASSADWIASAKLRL